MTLTKNAMIDTMCTQCGMSRSQAAKSFETFLEIIKKALESGEDVLVSGFGRFCVKEKRERKGRNPQTGEDMMLRPRKVVTFQCSTVLKGRMNGEA
jgi:integration host factor subunit alpha